MNTGPTAMDYFNIAFIQVIFFCAIITLGGTSDEFISRTTHFKLIGGQWVETESKNKVESVKPSASNKVHIKVFYESLCPGSISFLTNQLRPAAEKLAPYLDIHLVPYGHAKTREEYGQYTFQCQHGPQECFGNKIHACAVDVLNNNTQAALFNACLMRYSNYRRDVGFDYDIVVNWCNYKLKIQPKGLWACVHGDRSSILLKSYGEETREIGLRFIPYVVIDGSTERQDEATRDLSSMVCRMLQPTPSACYNLKR